MRAVIGGATLWCEMGGQGEPPVLVPGFAGGHHTWDGFIDVPGPHFQVRLIMAEMVGVVPFATRIDYDGVLENPAQVLKNVVAFLVG